MGARKIYKMALSDCKIKVNKKLMKETNKAIAYCLTVKNNYTDLLMKAYPDCYQEYDNFIFFFLPIDRGDFKKKKDRMNYMAEQFMDKYSTSDTRNFLIKDYVGNDEAAYDIDEYEVRHRVVFVGDYGVDVMFSLTNKENTNANDDENDFINADNAFDTAKEYCIEYNSNKDNEYEYKGKLYYFIDTSISREEEILPE